MTNSKILYSLKHTTKLIKLDQSALRASDPQRKLFLNPSAIQPQIRNGSCFANPSLQRSSDFANPKKFLQTRSTFDKVEFSDLQLPLQLTKWVKDPKLTLFLVGDSGTGKTLFCHVLAREKHFNVLEINHVDGLRDITQDHQMLVFDHFDFKTIRKPKFLSLLDTQENHNIRVSRGSVKKPKGLVQVVNLNPEQLKSLSKRLNNVDFLRRIYIVELDQPILHNLELHKDIQKHNNEELKLMQRNQEIFEKV